MRVEARPDFARARSRALRLVAASLLFLGGCAGGRAGSAVSYDPSTGTDGGQHQGDGDGHNPHGGGDGDTSANDDAGHPPPKDDNPAHNCGDGTDTLVNGLAISDLALYQTIKLSLLQNGSWVQNRPIPVVQGKKALLRVFVSPQGSFSSHAIRGVLTIDNGSGTPKYVTADFSPNGTSSDVDMTSTVNFNIDGADLGANTQLSVALVETSCPGTAATDTSSRFPSSGLQALGAQAIGKLKVVLVPVVLNGTQPPMTDAQVKSVHDSLLAYYPVPEVEVSVRAPMDWQQQVDPSGNGWDELLNGILEQRYNDGVSEETYYFGMMAPASNLMDFCCSGGFGGGCGCVLGLAPQAPLQDPTQRGGLGIGFEDPETYITITHELGHAHGRGHSPSPCDSGQGIQGVDDAYPYPDGTTSTWGWDNRDGTLKNPQSMDIMGYCEPNFWISDYNYGALAERSASVNVLSRILGGSEKWASIILHGEGTARWGAHKPRTRPTANHPEAALVKNAAGQVIAHIEVVRVGLSHSASSFLYLPEPKSDWHSIVLGDRELTLSQVLPAFTL